MNRKIVYILTGIVLSCLVLGLDFFGYADLSYTVELFIIPSFAILYFWKAKIKPFYLSLFVGFYALGDFVRFFDVDNTSNTLYYVCNSFFIIGYVFLVAQILKTIKFKSLLNYYRLEFFTLLLLLCYMIYVLVSITEPIKFETNNIFSVQVLEFFYNILLLLVLIISFLNYIQNTSKKHLILFVGCSILVFSELILIGYYYILDDIRFSYFSSILYIASFLLIFYQSQLQTSIEEEY